MARCVRDLALLLQVLAGPDPLDPACHPDHPEDYVQALTTTFGGGRKPRLGRLRGLFESRAEPVMRELMDRVCGQLAAAGASIIEVPLPAAFAEVIARHRIVMAVEAAAYHEERLRRHPEDYPPRITSLLEEGLACPAPEYARTREHQALLSTAMRACLQTVDALLCPATTGPAPAIDTTGDPAFNSPWSYVGLPTVSLPAALSPERLPVAIQLVGRAFGEGPLLAAAAWCEEVLQWPLADVEPANDPS
jgi:aspartyl-tRNA(Asn)/glutamyl-tRNA(Gln) amidotransferase subunit A